MTTIQIFGEIVSDASQAWTENDMYPSRFSELVSMEKNEVVVEMNSVGGDCFAGMTICSMIESLSKKGVKTTCRVLGLAASISSVIACSCDELVMTDGSYLMLHCPWTVCQGNSKDLQKQIEVMDKIRDSLIAIYQKKFNLSYEQLREMMEEETWISDAEISDYSLNAISEEGGSEYAIAASIRNYKNVPKALRNKMRKIKNAKSLEEIEKNLEETKKEVEELKQGLDVPQKPTEEEGDDKSEDTDEGTDKEVSEGDTEEESEQKEGKCDEDPKDADGDSDEQNPDGTDDADDKGSEDDGAVKTPDENEEEVSKEEEKEDADEEDISKDADEPEVKNELARLVDRLSACESKRRDFQAKCDKLASENRILKDQIERMTADASAVKNQLESEKNELEKRLARLADSVFKVETEEFVDTRSHKEILASLPPSERAAYYKKHRDAIDR